MFDFDRPIQRVGPDCADSTKWNKYAGRDVIPLWVADMDFAAPPAVIAALHRRVDHGVFGYGQPWPSLTQAVVEHAGREYGWAIEPDWIVWLPGVVTGLHLACLAFTPPGAGVFTATPVYPSFLSVPPHAGRQAITLPLPKDEAGWEWDWAALDGVLRRARPSLFLLCHPHNPVGRAWREDELAQLLALAEKYDFIVCSDEIHCDLMLEERRHRPFAALSPEAARRTVTLMAPSKTFNVPGLGCAFAIVPDARLRRSFRSVAHDVVPPVNTLGLVACEAALREGGEWRRELLAYLRTNARLCERFVDARPELAMAPVEATYLAWIDARAVGAGNPQRFFEEAGVGLSDGADFGAPGFVRLNFGCRRALLEEALARMGNALGQDL